jgi:hypothetical protein
MVPATGALAFDLEAAQRRPTLLPSIQPTALPPIEPIQPRGVLASQSTSNGFAGAFSPYPVPVYQPYPVYVPVPAGAPMRSAPPQIIYVNPPAGGEVREVHFHEGTPPAALDGRRLATTLPMSTPPLTPTFGGKTPTNGLDRISLSSWALIRSTGGPDSLSNSGTLGGSEAGARLMWRFDPRLAATLRTSAPINSQRGLEAALGLRYQPFSDWPVALTIERRHGFKDYGRNAFALFAEGGA